MKKKQEQKPEKPKGRRGLKGAIHGNGFDKKGQPDPESKKAGWAKRRLLKELLGIQMTGKVAGDKRDYVQAVATMFKIPVNQVTVEMVMHFKQIEKVIKNGDTFAYNAVMDRAFGRPKQAVDVNTNDLNKLPIEFE